jgi:hypothetical protein
MSTSSNMTVKSPPKRITLPTSSVYVFSSSRNPRQTPSSPVPSPIDHTTMASSSVALNGQHQSQPPSPRGKPKLSDQQLVRHGAGAQDLRSALLYARTPAGFTPFDTAPPTSYPQLSSPPTYEPDHNPFFPPVVVLGGSAFNQPPTHYTPLPTVDERYATPSSPSTLRATSSLYEEGSHRSRARPTPSAHSSDSSSSTLVSNTDIHTNSITLPKKSMSTPRAREDGLSLTELFAADWTTSASHMSSGSSSKRRERRAMTAEQLKPKTTTPPPSKLEHGSRNDHSGSDSEKRKTSSPDMKTKSHPTRKSVAHKLVCSFIHLPVASSS